MILLTYIAYILLCVVVGYMGRNTKFGMVGWALISVFFSPLIGFLFYYLLEE